MVRFSHRLAPPQNLKSDLPEGWSWRILGLGLCQDQNASTGSFFVSVCADIIFGTKALYQKKSHKAKQVNP